MGGAAEALKSVGISRGRDETGMMLERQCKHWKCKPYLISISSAFMVIWPPAEHTVMNLFRLKPGPSIMATEHSRTIAPRQLQLDARTATQNRFDGGLIGKPIFKKAT